jgi:hypothetical protein
MADTLALEKLFDDVVNRFDYDDTKVPNLFGWQSPERRGGRQNRICWVPGDPSGALGGVTSARCPGGNPRSIGTLEETFTVYLEGRDRNHPEDELCQYKATRLLFDAWYRAAYLSVRNLLEIKSAAWMTDRKTRRHGATLRIVCSLQAMIPDEAFIVAPADLCGVARFDLDTDWGTASVELVTVGEEPPLALVPPPRG